MREIFKRFWPYARPYRWFIWLTLPLIALATAAETARIWLFKILVDRVLVPHDFGPFWWIALGYVGVTLLAGAVAVGDSYLSSWVGGKFIPVAAHPIVSSPAGSLARFLRAPAPR